MFRLSQSLCSRFVVSALALATGCAGDGEGLYHCIEDNNPSPIAMYCAPDEATADEECNFDCGFGDCDAMLVESIDCNGDGIINPLVSTDSDRRFTLDSANSYVNVFDSHGNFSGQIRMTGNVYFSGNTCVGCSVTLNGLELYQVGENSLRGYAITDGGLFSKSHPTITMGGSGNSQFQNHELILSLGYKQNGAKRAIEIRNPDPTSIVFSPDGSLRIQGDFADGYGGTIGVVLNFVQSNQRPTANASVSVTRQGCDAVATFDGSGSVDPDANDTLTYSWVDANGVVVSSAPGFSLPLAVGSYHYTLRIHDAAMAYSTTEVWFDVPPDTTPPVINVASDELCLWPPRHDVVLIPLGEGGLDATATDECGTPDLRIESVSSSEPADGLGDGTTSPDVSWGASALCARAERSGTGDGREYSVVLVATDAAGNESTVTVVVRVPHDRRPRHCLEIADLESGMIDTDRCAPEPVDAGTPSGTAQASLPSAPVQDAPQGLNCSTTPTRASGSPMVYLAGLLAGFALLRMRRRHL